MRRRRCSARSRRARSRSWRSVSQSVMSTVKRCPSRALAPMWCCHARPTSHASWRRSTRRGWTDCRGVDGHSGRSGRQPPGDRDRWQDDARRGGRTGPRTWSPRSTTPPARCRANWPSRPRATRSLACVTCSAHGHHRGGHHRQRSANARPLDTSPPPAATACSQSYADGVTMPMFEVRRWGLSHARRSRGVGGLVSTVRLRSPLVARWKSPPSAGFLVCWGLTSLAGFGVSHAVGLAAGDHGGGVVQESVEHADGGGVFG